MTGLISDTEMDALRQLPLMGMQTPMSILRHTLIERDGADDQRVWATIENLKGWIWEPPDYPSGNVVGGVVGDSNEFRVYLPVGTDVESGDRIGVDGDIFNVMNTSSHNTYQPMLRVAVRRLE